MGRIYHKSVIVIKTRPVVLTCCGPACGFWCQGGRRCNQSDLGRGFVELPPEVPEDGFPEVCRLAVQGVQCDLFAAVSS
jgi:hypothetical protein